MLIFFSLFYICFDIIYRSGRILHGAWYLDPVTGNSAPESRSRLELLRFRCKLVFPHFVAFSFFLDTFTFVPLYPSCYSSCLSFFFLVLLFTCASFTGKTKWRSSTFLMAFLPGTCSLHSAVKPLSWQRSAIKLLYNLIYILLYFGRESQYEYLMRGLFCNQRT